MLELVYYRNGSVRGSCMCGYQAGVEMTEPLKQGMAILFGDMHAKTQQLQDIFAPVFWLAWTAKDLFILEQTVTCIFVPAQEKTVSYGYLHGVAKVLAIVTIPSHVN